MRLGISTAAAFAALVVSLPPAPAFADGTNAFAQARAPVEIWQFRTLAYLWMIGASGNTTIQNQTVGLTSSFTDTVKGKESVFGLMMVGEARKGDWAFYLDAVYGRYSYSGSTLTGLSLSPGLSVTAGGESGLKYTIAMVEAGAAYEMTRWRGGLSGPGAYTALEALGGLRYWRHSYEMTFGLTGPVNLGLLGLQPLTVNGVSYAVARSGTMQWVDPLVGLRLRHQFAPGRTLRVSGDIGGFGAGSSFSWQVQAAYTHDFRLGGFDLTAMAGYRAISLKYGEGRDILSGRIDLLFHGPMVGLGARW